MNCPGCGAPLRLATGRLVLRCDYCGTIVPTGPTPDGLAYLDPLPDRACPACAQPLWQAALGGAALTACKHCRGLLIPMTAFPGLIAQLRAAQPAEAPPAPVDRAADRSELARHLSCPLCHRPMETHFYYGGSHVVMADCPFCEQNWLDAGALAAIVRAPHGEEL